MLLVECIGKRTVALVLVVRLVWFACTDKRPLSIEQSRFSGWFLCVNRYDKLFRSPSNYVFIIRFPTASASTMASIGYDNNLSSLPDFFPKTMEIQIQLVI